MQLPRSHLVIKMVCQSPQNLRISAIKRTKGENMKVIVDMDKVRKVGNEVYELFQKYDLNKLEARVTLDFLIDAMKLQTTVKWTLKDLKYLVP